MQHLYLLLFLAFSTSCKSDSRYKKFSINGTELQSEIANTEPKRQKGLMYRDQMEENHGMLFVFDQPTFLSFWMKNTKIPLSIAYIDEKCILIDIQKMEPHYGKPGHPPSYPSRKRAQYALEMNQGWFQKNNIKVGDTLKGLGSKTACSTK